MNLTFAPPLYQTTTLAIPFSASQEGCSTQRLRFKAAFESRAAYEHARNRGMRVEMWTDLPVNGENSGDWHAIAFRYRSDERDVLEDIAPAKVISLSPGAREVVQHHSETAVYADVEFLTLRASRFSFTYRLVHSDGRIDWLGTYGHNGVLLIEDRDERLSLVRDWERIHGGRNQHRELGTLNTDWVWQIWAVGKDGRPNLTGSLQTPQSSTLVLFPSVRPRTHSILQPQAIVLSADSGGAISITRAGSIVFHPGEDGSLRVLLSPDAKTISEALDTTSTRVLNDELESNFAIVASTPADGMFPSTLSLIPLSVQKEPSSDVHVNLHDLASLLRTENALITSSTQPAEITFLALPSVDAPRSSAHISFRVNASGAQAILAPIYYLTKPEEKENEPWSIAVLTPHANAKVRMQEQEQDLSLTLPTPPPSPPVHVLPSIEGELSAFHLSEPGHGTEKPVVSELEAEAEAEKSTAQSTPSYPASLPSESSRAQDAPLASAPPNSEPAQPQTESSEPTGSEKSEHGPLTASRTPRRTSLRSIIRFFLLWVFRAFLGRMWALFGVSEKLFGLGLGLPNLTTTWTWAGSGSRRDGPQVVDEQEDEEEQDQDREQDLGDSALPVPLGGAGPSELPAEAEDNEFPGLGVENVEAVPLSPVPEETEDESVIVAAIEENLKELQELTAVEEKAHTFTHTSSLLSVDVPGSAGPAITLVVRGATLDTDTALANLGITLDGEQVSVLSYKTIGMVDGLPVHLVELGRSQKAAGKLEFMLN